MTERTRQQIILDSGHKLGFAEFGSAEGFPIVYCHGFPASRLEGTLYESSALRKQVRLIVADRPGYGLSDIKPVATVADWTDDLIELVNHLGIERFCVVGVSGGGPYSLACAYKIPGRLHAVAVVCGLGPVYEEWALERMKWPARLGFGLAKRYPWLLPVVYGNLTATVMRSHPSLCQALLTISAPQSDQDILKTKSVAESIDASLREALRNGASGALGDFRRYANHWGFDLEDIETAVNLWHGEADRVVPVSHGEYFKATLPRICSFFIPHEGHFSLPIRFMDDIFDHLAYSAEHNRSMRGT